MQPTFLEHPSEEVLERFVMNKSGDEELEIVETHILACESCVTRLETLESEIADIKMAAAAFRLAAVEKEYSASKASWMSWFTLPKLSWAGAVAALALGITLVPQFLQHNAPVADVSLSAYRGTESATVPARETLRLHLNAEDLPAGAVTVQLADDRGVTIWEGPSTINHDQVNVTVPSIKETGPHFLRLYERGSNNTEGDLLREFSFQVK